jgi:hypothetical protein
MDIVSAIAYSLTNSIYSQIPNQSTSPIANLKRGLHKGVASIDNDGSIEAINKKEVDSIINS